jgi:DNA gyrase/topoisomerase IV subunit A
MLDKKDAQWWVLEAQKHPESATDLIRNLADRLAFLDKQNEELRGELITLRRKQRSEAASADTDALQQRIRELESALRQGKVEQRLVVYAPDRIEINVPLAEVLERGLDRQVPHDVSLLIGESMAKLLIVTAESQAFNVALADLPMPQNDAAMLGNPNNIATILDQSVFESCRFLALLTRGGYVYSLLSGTVNQNAKRQDKLIRHLIPDDPVIAVVPSHNADLLAVSQKGRWTRFAEKAIAGAGSLVMELPKGDSLVGIVSLSRETNLTLITEDGKLFVRSTDDLKARRGPGISAGMLLKGQSIMGLTTGSEIAVLTRLGKLLTVKVAQLPYKAQTEVGVPLPGLSADDSILAFTAY